jgi:hypothetical protein
MRSLQLFLAPLVAVPLAAQATLHVPADHPTIQQAIAAASSGDTVLVAPGTYVEQLDFLGKAITVASSGGAKVTTVDSQGLEEWLDFPHAPVVRMIHGEGPLSVLAGFTVTGSKDTSGFQAEHTGIWCSGLSPTIRDCVVRDNTGALGAGVFGNALLERCTIQDNTTVNTGDGGGVFGQPTLVDCTLTGNHSSGKGGGLYATGPCLVTGTVISSNIAGNGSDGYSGGGVYGPATLIGCQITSNSAHHYFSGGPPDEIGTGVDGAAALIRCTVADNFIALGPVVDETSGGIKDVGVVESSILWNNQGHDVAVHSSPSISYSIVGGGYPGAGNLALNPAFLDAPGGDYFLKPASPAIDAGNPGAALDPDGTRADMGAYFFPQYAASVAVRNGTGVNPLCYSSVLDPVLGTTWVGSVDATAHGFPVSLVLVVGTLQPITPLALPFGELLVNPTPIVIDSSAAPVSGLSIHPVPIPADYALGGLTIYTQAVVLGASIGLGNGLDLALGI